MNRQPNDNPDRLPPCHLMQFRPHEFAFLKRRPHGGGYQNMENYVIDATDPKTLICVLDPVHFERLLRYLVNYGSGGPNGDLRNACIPALRRTGIDIRPTGKRRKAA